MTISRPRNGRVLIERVEADTVSAGGIIVPGNAKLKPLEGKVTAVSGDDTDVQAGDRVLFARYSEVEVTVDEQVLLLVDEADLLAVLL